MHTIKNCFYKNLTFEKLFLAHKRARMHKTYKPEIIEFEMDLENNLSTILSNIKNGKYRVGTYRQFTIYEPKERIIKALPYVDRVVHQWYVEEFIKPFFVPKFIDTSFACLENKGTHKAVEMASEYMRTFKRNSGDFWILKCDIKRFFYCINPYILFDILSKYISDKKLLEFTHLIIFDSRLEDENLGIPIGNYTSQFFANIYLNELDQFIKHELKQKYYLRYMDDFVVLAKSKLECKTLKEQIKGFLDARLQLELNSKSRYYPCNQGLNFCGYRIFPTHKLLRSSSKKTIKRNVKKWNYLWENNQLDIPNAMQSLHSWIGHSSHCNSYRIRAKILNSCKFLYRE